MTRTAYRAAGDVRQEGTRTATMAIVTVLRLLLATALASAPLHCQNTVQVALNCNWNGIAHAGETGVPDAPNGFRSISDRALDFTGGVPSHPVLARYALVTSPGALDMVQG